MADLAAGLEDRDAERDQDVALAGAGRAGQAEVLGSGDSIQGREIIQLGARDRACRPVSSSGMDHRECGVLRARALGGSRAATLVSTRVHSYSGGVYRWAGYFMPDQNRNGWRA